MKQPQKHARWIVPLAVFAGILACLGLLTLLASSLAFSAEAPASGEETRAAADAEPVEATQTAIVDAAVEPTRAVTATAPAGGQPTPALDLTQTAAVFDAVATADSYGATALPSGGQAVAAIDRAFTIYDEAGKRLGDGQVKVYAPRTVDLGERGEIRVEISVQGDVPTVEVTVIGPSDGGETASGEEPQGPEQQLIGNEPLAVREYMGAGLRGLDVAHFRVEAVPENGLRRVRSNTVAWWKWDIAPVGEEAVGTNYLEVYIYLPRTRDDGTRLDEETNTIPLTVEVPAPVPEGLPLGVLLAGVLSVLGAGGALYGGWQFAQARRRSAVPPPALPDDGPGRDINLSIGDDVEGTLTVAGDDVVTYQTIVNEAPTTLIIGLLIGLTALIIGLVIIVLVVTTVL